MHVITNRHCSVPTLPPAWSQKPGLGMGALLHVGAAFLGHAHQYGRIFRWHDEGANHGQVFADQCVA